MIIFYHDSTIVGIFGNLTRAGDYLHTMPIGKCRVRHADLRFPFFVVESGYGCFELFQTEAEACERIQTVDVGTVTVFRIDDDFCPDDAPWTDQLGRLPHHHIGDDEPDHDVVGEPIVDDVQDDEKPTPLWE